MSGFELEVRKRIKKYWVRKALSIILAIISLVFFLIIVWDDDIVMQVNGGEGGVLFGFFLGFFSELFFIAGWFAIYIGLVIYSYGAGAKIRDILMEECDPYLYEACVKKTTFGLFNPDLKKFNCAMTAYYKGDFQKAWEIFQSVRLQKVRGRMADYYQLKALLYFEMGLGGQVCQIEEEFRMRAVKPKMQKKFRMFCAVNNIRRACGNKDYQMAYRFIQERLESTDNLKISTLQKVNFTYWNGLVDAGAGNLEAAREKLSWAAVKGNRVYTARRAKELLKTINGS